MPVLPAYAAHDWGAVDSARAATQLASLPAAAVFEADTVPIDEEIWTCNPVEECAVYGRDESSDVASCNGRVVQSRLKLYFLTFVTKTTYILQRCYDSATIEPKRNKRAIDIVEAGA